VPHLARVARQDPVVDLGVAARERFPFSVPAVRALTSLDLDTPVTFFVGENGTGTSTLLEGIAAAADLRSLGSADLWSDDSLVAQRALSSALRLSWSRRTRVGFFLRAEHFFGYLRRLARNDARVLRERDEADGRRPMPAEEDPRGTEHVDEVESADFLLAYPGARIYSFDSAPVREVAFGGAGSRDAHARLPERSGALLPAPVRLTGCHDADPCDPDPCDPDPCDPDPDPRRVVADTRHS
jgi:predicted ATPase